MVSCMFTKLRNHTINLKIFSSAHKNSLYICMQFLTTPPLQSMQPLMQLLSLKTCLLQTFSYKWESHNMCFHDWLLLMAYCSQRLLMLQQVSVHHFFSWWTAHSMVGPHMFFFTSSMHGNVSFPTCLFVFKTALATMVCYNCV